MLTKASRSSSAGSGGRMFLFVLPDAVENPAIWENSYVDVGNEDVVEAALLFVPEERIGHPDFLCVGHR